VSIYTTYLPQDHYSRLWGMSHSLDKGLEKRKRNEEKKNQMNVTMSTSTQTNTKTEVRKKNIKRRQSLGKFTRSSSSHLQNQQKSNLVLWPGQIKKDLNNPPTFARITFDMGIQALADLL